MKLEICASSLVSALEAQKGGADRVELCENLEIGGTTPSYGTISLAREMLHIGLNVMIRPRGGDFLYSDVEFDIMKKDTVLCRDLGVDGVVAGILLPDGKIDINRMKMLKELAGPLNFTFHRAFDYTPDPYKAVDELASLGIDHILTAGQQNTVPEGIDLLGRLVKYAGSRIVIMPGSGINKDNIEWIVEKTGAAEFHTTAKKLFVSAMLHRPSSLSLYLPDNPPEYTYMATDANLVSAIRQVLKKSG